MFGEEELDRASVSFQRGEVNCAGLGGEAKLVVAGMTNGEVQLVSRGDGQNIQRIGLHTSPVVSIQVDSDGQRVVSIDESGQVKVWDVTPSRAIVDLAAGSTSRITEFARGPGSARRTPEPASWLALPGGRADERILLGEIAHSGGGVVALRGLTRKLQGKYEVELWDAVTGKLRSTIKQNRERVSAIAVSPDGKRVAISPRGSSVRIFLAENGMLDGRPVPIAGTASVFAFSPLGIGRARLAVGTDRGRAIHHRA